MLKPFTIVSLWDMIEAKIGTVSNALAHLSSYWRLLERRRDFPDGGAQFTPDQLATFKHVTEVIQSFSKVVTAPVTKSNCDEILLILLAAEKTSGCVDKVAAAQLVQYLTAIQNAFPAETEAKKAFIIDNRHSDFYVGADEALHFGVKALDAFPSVKYEVSEASNCIALGRWTASVMHIMRAMEVPLHALAVRLSVSVEAKNWKNILDQIDCEAKKATKSGMGADEYQFINEATSHLRSVKDAFRNHAMHLNTTYDEERALAIWNGAKSFMHHLSSRLSE